MVRAFDRGQNFWLSIRNENASGVLHTTDLLTRMFEAGGPRAGFSVRRRGARPRRQQGGVAFAVRPRPRQQWWLNLRPAIAAVSEAEARAGEAVIPVLAAD
jgi:hypothetical protein